MNNRLAKILSEPGCPINPRIYEDRRFQENLRLLNAVFDGTEVGKLYHSKALLWVVISDISVPPEFRRRGVGTALVNRAKELLVPARTELYVIVRSKNLIAQRFFLSQSFIFHDTYKKHFGSPEDDGYYMLYTPNS